MTTIGPQKKRNTYKPFIVGFLSIFLVGAGFGISLYNGVVNAHYEIKRAETRIAELQVENIEIKKGLLDKLDANRLVESASDLGLVLDKKPTYLEITHQNLAQAE